MKLSEVMEALTTFESENHTRILVACGVAAMIGAVASAFVGGSNAGKVLKERKRKGDEKLAKLQSNEITKEDYDKAVKADNKAAAIDICKSLAPAVGLGIVSAVLEIKAQKDNESVIESLGLSLAASKVANDKLMKTISSQRDAEKKLLGEAKAKEVREETTRSKIQDGVFHASRSGVEQINGGGVRHYDVVMDYEFDAPMGTVDMAMAKLTVQASTEFEAAVNDFYDLMGSRFHPKVGDILGWVADDITANGIPISKTSILTDDGTPAICIDYDLHFLPNNFLG